MVDLKACPTPWCDGGRGVPYVFERRHDAKGVYCPTCCVTTEYFPTEAEAIAAWETRPDSAADLREALEGDDVRFHLVWIAGARPPVHPEPMTGRRAFETLQAAIRFMERQAPDAKFVSLTQTTTFETDRSADARAALAHGDKND